MALWCVLVTVSAGNQPSSTPTPAAAGEVFRQAMDVVRERFYDPNLHGVDWSRVRDQFAPRAAQAGCGEGVSRVINEALDRLHASHTRHYHRSQREYYELLDVFNPDGINPERFPGCGTGLVGYVGVGVVAVKVDGRTFAGDVYEAGPAAQAGLHVGDELLGVEDGPWSDIDAFAGREGKPTRVHIQRTKDAGSRRTLLVTPVRINPLEMFKESMRRGARVIQKEETRLGYVRVRSYANPAYQELLADLLQRELAGVDGLVLDLRGGWGGASPEYVNLFNPVTPRLGRRSRADIESGAEWQEQEFAFRKPLVLLVDGESRSGKEIFAHALRKHGRARLVGERTGGAVLGGTPIMLRDGSMLYLAVMDVRVDGERLEGVGVPVDDEVKRTIPYAGGADAQFDRAIEVLREGVRAARAGIGRR